MRIEDDALVCFPTRIDWEMTQPPAAAEPFPAPLVTSRDGQEDVIVHPSVVDSLAAYAQSLGWQTKISYSEGWVPHATTGKPLGPKVLWAIRMRRDAVGALAVRTDDQWTSLWLTGDTWTRLASLAAFKKAIT